MLRYLVQSPPDPKFPNEKDHDVDLAFGLGLSPTVWRGIRERFGIPWIVEYYSASEATTALVNSNKNDRGVGKVAHYGPLMQSRWFGQTTFYTVRTDLESGDILRDSKTGFCTKTRPDEVGESICRITPPIQCSHDYVGEGGREATEKKLLRDVFEKGDTFFRLGDAMVVVSQKYTKTAQNDVHVGNCADTLDANRTKTDTLLSMTDWEILTGPRATTFRRLKSKVVSVDIQRSPL